MEWAQLGRDQAESDRDGAWRHREVASSPLQPFGDLAGGLTGQRVGEWLQFDIEHVVDPI